jgi:hypothetical protein
MQAYWERTILLLNVYPSGRQKDRNKRERSKADVNGGGSTIPQRDISMQMAEPPSLQKKKTGHKAGSVTKLKETEKIFVKNWNARDRARRL